MPPDIQNFLSWRPLALGALIVIAVAGYELNLGRRPDLAGELLFGLLALVGLIAVITGTAVREWWWAGFGAVITCAAGYAVWMLPAAR